MSHKENTPSLEAVKDEEFWTDFVEGEIDDSLKEDVELLLKRDTAVATAYKSLVEDIQKTKDIVESASVQDELPQDDEYYKKLHSQIMAKVGQVEVLSFEEIEKEEHQVEENVFRLPSYLMMGGVAALFVAVLSVLLFQNTQNGNQGFKNVANQQEASEKDWLLRASADNPEVFAESILSVESQEDFVSKAAEKKVEQLSDEELKKIIDDIIE